MPLLTANNLAKTYRVFQKKTGLTGALKGLFRREHKEVKAVDDVSFSVEPGEMVAFLGPNGAGKTTTLKMLAGLIYPTSGTAKVMDFTPWDRVDAFRRQFSLVMGQKNQLWWDLPASDSFALHREIYSLPTESFTRTLGQLTEMFGVGELLKQPVRELSLGERMKMELIGAILHWPKVIYLDEPTIGLDTLAAHKLREFLRVFNEREKATIILTSHNMDDIERLCSRVIILRSGQLIYDGRPGGLTRETERQLRIRFREARDPADLARVSGIAPNLIEVVAAEEEGTPPTANFTVAQDQIVPTLQKLMAAFPIVDMGIESESLERVIHRIYEEEKKA